ncbi:MAG: hypothetical protein PHR36_05295, partial [Patescibacteria group bacterium]|nr:hypothetical protein [Patescibacteria group bacterium]
MIKTIVFDLGGVYFENGTKNIMPKLIELIGAPEEKVKEIFVTYPYKKEGWLYRTGKISKHEFWQAAKKKLNISNKQVTEIQKLWHSSYTPM